MARASRGQQHWPMRLSQPRRRWRGALVLLGLACLVGAGLIFVAAPMIANWTSGFFFYPSPEIEETPDAAGVAWRREPVTTAGGVELDAWWIEAVEVDGVDGADHSAPLVVHAHGNAGNLSNHWRGAAVFAQRGLDVVAFDYRGFGRSPGRVSRRSAVEDLRAVLDHAAALARSEQRSLVVVGQSMGAAIALEAVRGREDVAALALDSPFSSWHAIAAHHVARDAWHAPLTRLGLRLVLAGGGDDPVELARHLTIPVHVVAGDADEVCPAFMAAEIVDAAGSGGRLLLLENAPHVGRREPEHDARAYDAMVRFLREHTPAR